MDLTCCHVMLSVSDIAAAKEFYVEKLGLGLIEAYPKFFAVRAGEVRFSVFAGGERRSAGDNADAPATLILRTGDLERTMKTLGDRGVEFEADVSEAPNFMRYVPLFDPDGNRLYIAQYMGDPFAAA